MDRFWKLLEESVLVQASVTLIMISVVCYMYVVGKEVPEALVNLVALVLGFYFGSKTQHYLNKEGKK